jgi:hypothetical protein
MSPRFRAAVASTGFASASVVARGRATAPGAGTVTLRLRPTKPAKRAARRLRRVVLTVKVSQGGASGATRIRLR